MIPELFLYDFSATESERILRLPLFYGLTENEVALICNSIKMYIK